MVINRRKKRWSKHFPISSHRKKTAKPEKQTIADTVTAWLSAHRPVFLFLLIFCVLMGLFYAITILVPFYKEQIFLWHLRLNARIAGRILDFLGQNVTVVDNSIFSAAFSVNIVRGCDVVEPTALFICAVLSFPASFVKKIPGIIAGIFFLAIVNLVRIFTLFLIGMYLPKIFNVMHVDVWQALFILLAIIFWGFWLLWVTKSPTPVQNLSS